MVILYEASGVYTLVLPALLCSCFAVWVSHLVEEEEFFHRQAREFLEQRGVQIADCEGDARRRQMAGEPASPHILEIGRRTLGVAEGNDGDSDDDDLGIKRLRKGGGTPKEFNNRR